MKKLLVLSVLLGLFALPAFSADVTFGGDLSYGFVTDFETVSSDPALTIDMAGSVDDYNSVAISLDNFVEDAGGPFGLEKAVITTDIGAWLDLPVGVKLQWGWDDPDLEAFGDVTNWETEAFYDFSPDEYWGLDAVVSFGMVELEVAFTPISEGTAGGGHLLAGLAVKEPIEGLNAELYYFQGQSLPEEFGDGLIVFDAGYAGAFGDFDLEAGLNFQYNLSDVGDAYGYGIGLTGTYSIVYAEVSLIGDETDALDTMTAAVHIGPFADLATIFGALDMDFSDAAAETFQGAEFGLEFVTGATTWWVGYQINNDAMAEYKADAVNTDGGLFCSWDINY